jgi:OFA family oxalate/formate antiporter-like MFS transporter
MQTKASAQSIEDMISRPASYRWMQLFIGILCMCMIANLQYGWTLFVNPITEKFGWTKAAIQVAFTVFVLTETWLVPIEGYLVDRFGPRIVVMIGGILCGIGWVWNSMADSLMSFYIAAAISGVGAGAVYGTCVGNALKWFPDRRGLAAGLTAAGFGAGSALTVIPIAAIIKASGYQTAFLYFGIGQGLIVFLASIALTAPAQVRPGTPSAKAASKPSLSPAVIQTRVDFQPLQLLGRPVFWVMYVMFVMVAAGGLMAVAQLGPIAKDFAIDKVPVSLIGITLPALTFALSLDRILNGLTRPFFGWVSDHVGRENTMFIAFGLEALTIMFLFYFGRDPVLFVLLTALVFFGWGEIFSLFPSTTTDTFGAKFAAANAGLMYTAKGTAALLVPWGNVLKETTGSWHSVFVTCAILNGIAALMAILVLKPMRRAQIERTNQQAQAQARLPGAAAAT